MMNTMKEIGERLRTQDNRATADPIFVVEKKVRDYGVDTDWQYHGYTWVGKNGDECCPDEEEPCDHSECEKRYYRERWEFVQPFFTEEAADQFASSNSYHYEYGTRVYVHSAWRNHEFQAVRKELMEVKK
jgi:hypothetical protein